MSDRDDMIQALHAADAAGDNDAAEHLARAISAMPDESAAPTKPAKDSNLAPNGTPIKPPKGVDPRRFDPSAPPGANYTEPETLDTPTLVKSAYQGGKRLVLGAQELTDKLIDDPMLRAAGKLTGQNVEPIIADKTATREKRVADTRASLAEQSKTYPFSSFLGASIPSAVVAAPLTPELGIPGAVGRVANTMAGAGGQATLEPVDDPKRNFAAQKAEQFGIGASIGAVAHGLGEAGSAIKGAVNRYVLFGDVGDAASPIQKYWKKAKDMGFNISPQQARQDAGRIQTPGITYTQREQNRLAANLSATKPTGIPSGIIDKEYLGNAFKDVSAQYDKIYIPGASLKVDGSAVAQLQDFVDRSTAAQLGNPWANREAMTAAQKLLDAYHGVAGQAGSATNIKMKIDGQTLNRLVSELKSSSAKLRDGFQREDLGEVINSINESVARNNPAVKAALDEVNPKYRTLKTLEVLSHNGGIDANGNIDPQVLAKLLRRSDNAYARNNSTHPLKDLAEVGETFGIRAPSQPTIAGGRTVSGVDVPTTRSSMLQTAIEHGKEALPGFQTGFTRYKLGESGQGLDRGEQQSITGMISAAEANEKNREDTHR